MRNISKYVLALGLSFALIGCTAEDSGQSDNTTTTVTLESGQTMTIAEGPIDESHEPIASSDDIASLTEDGYSTEGCWVILNWCVDPRTGSPTCTATGCTSSEANYHCHVLVDQYC